MDPPVLRRVERLDSIPLGGACWTEEGYLRDKPIVTSVGIFSYQNPDGTTRRELRLPEHVFDPESLASYRGKPVILTHRAGSVDKDNVQREHIGTILSEGIPEGENVRVEIVIHDTDAVKRTGLRELSLGYSLDLDETPGTWNGQPYDAVQTNIRINHLALVSKARAGEQARLNIDSRDEKSEGGTKMDQESKDGLTEEQLAEAIQQYKSRMAEDACKEDAKPPVPPEAERPVTPPPSAPKPEQPADPVKLARGHRDARKADGGPQDAESTQKVLAQQDADIDALLELIEQMRAKSDFAAAPDVKADGAKPVTFNADSVDEIVRERVRLLRLCDRLNLDGVDDKSIPELKRAVIRSVKPALRLDGRSEVYIDAAFDVARQEVEARKDTNYQRRQMFNADAARPPACAAARRQQMIEDMDGGNKA